MQVAAHQGRAEDPPVFFLGRARWLAGMTAATSLIGLPVGMAIANKSAPFFLVLAAILANAAALATISPMDLVARYRALLSGGLSRLVLALAVLAIASFAWTIDAAASWRGLVEALPELLAACGLAAAWPAVVRSSDFALLKYGLLAALVLIVFEAFAGMPLHRLVGARAEDYDLKRSVVPVVLLLWPCAEFCLSRSQRAWIGGLAAAALAAGVVAHSSASVVAIVLSSGIYIAARVLPRSTLWASATVTLLLVVLAPWTGAITSRVLQPAGLTLLARQHADIRVGLWSNFGRHVSERLFLGHGFDASLMVANSPKLDHAQDFPMVWNVHPHNILLQVWVEFGLVGAALALFAVLFCAVKLRRLPAEPRASRLAFAVSAATVALVGLSAWTPWWMAVTFLGLVCFFILREAGNWSGR